MKSIDELREELAAGTDQLSVDIPADRIRRRARGMRFRRTATTVLVAGVVVAALSVPALLSLGRTTPATNIGGAPGQVGPTCAGPAGYDPGQVTDWLGDPAVTGATVVRTRPSRATYDVRFGITGSRDDPMVVVSFRDRQSNEDQPWLFVGVGRDAHGDLPGKHPSDPSRRFWSGQLVLGPTSILDIGLYTRSATRITVRAGGITTDAQLMSNVDTGWTLFWDVRSNPAVDPVTITAYDGSGTPPSSTTAAVAPVQNPRDGWPLSVSCETPPPSN